ncbi:MAG: HNH endonuclease [Pseudomonadota bacterium]
MTAPQHPFAGRQGSKKRKRLAIAIGHRDGFYCQLCKSVLYEGKQGRKAMVLDHIKPITLCPDLTWDEANLWLVCRHCHDTTCQSIEALYSGDAEMIAEAKRRQTETWG